MYISEVKQKSPSCVDSVILEFSRPEYWPGVGSHNLLQGIFPTQWSNPGLPHRRKILYQLRHQGNPRILEWVDYTFPVGLLDPGIDGGLPHCMWSFYQLSYQRSPMYIKSPMYIYFLSNSMSIWPNRFFGG